MILLVLVRRAVCSTCGKHTDLEPLQKPPKQCPHCGSSTWIQGPLDREGVYIRQGIKKKKRKLNPGAASKKRQDRGRRQWRQFRPKDVEDEANQKDN